MMLISYIEVLRESGSTNGLDKVMEYGVFPNLTLAKSKIWWLKVIRGLFCFSVARYWTLRNSRGLIDS